MKKLLFLIILLLGALVVLNAQMEAGKVLIGTSTELYGTTLFSNCGNAMGLAVTSSKYKTDETESDATNTTSLNVSPRIGFFAADQFLIGLEASFAMMSEKDWDEALTFLSGGPFARYYLNLSGFKPFVQAGGNIGQLKGTTGDKANVYHYGGGLGGAFFVSDKVSVDLLLNYAHQIMKEEDAENNARNVADSFGFGIGLSIFL